MASFFAGKKRRKASETTTKNSGDVDNPEKTTEAAADKEGTIEVKFKTVSDLDREEQHFWASIGEDGLKIMKDIEPLNEEKAQVIEKWWDALDDQAKATFLEDKKGYGVGLAFRTFLINKGLIPPDDGQYLNYDLLSKPEDERRTQEQRIKESMNRIEEDYRYWNSIGGEGIKYITGEEPFSDENAEKIMNWWNSLDDMTRGRISHNSLPAYRKLMEKINTTRV